MSSLKICPQCGAEYELDQRFCPKDGTTLRLQNETGDLVGAIVADRYHVLRKLGEGGMGQVYLAEHVKMGRKSALKVMNPSMVKDADAISRFNREASNASRINHPNVADVYDFGETPDGVIYLAMEFVDGPPLTKLVEEQGALPPMRAATIVRQASEALAVAHDMGIVHRDLKPDNIMIARNRDGSDCVKIVDFGIAKAADNAAQKVTKTGLVVGTPEYMSPEQLAGDKLDGRSDTYSLALVAFNMLTGKLPFPAETVQESMILRLTERARQLSEMRPEVPWTPEIQAVMNRALERDAAARYQTASEFGRELYRAVEAMLGHRDPASGIREPKGSGPAARVSSTRAMEAAAAAAPAPAAPASTAGSRLPAPDGPVAGNQVPSTRVGVDASAPGAPVPRKNRGAMLAVAAVILIAAIGGGAMMFKDRLAKAPDTEPLRAPLGSAADSAPSPGTQTAAAPTVPNVDARLATVESMNVLEKGSEADARKALRDLDALKGVPLTNSQLVRATLLRAEAQTALGDTADICEMVRRVREPATGTVYERRVNRFIQTGCRTPAS